MSDHDAGAPKLAQDRPLDVDGLPQALAAALQRLQAHADNSPLAVIEFDPQFTILSWSSGAQRMFGWRADEVVGKRIAQLHWVHEDDVQAVADLSERMLHGDLSRSVHVNRNYRKDGAVIACEWYNSSLLDAQGKLLSVNSLVLDVTERRRAESQREELLARFRRQKDFLDRIVSSAAIAIAVMKGERLEYISVNPAYQAIMGPHTQFVGRTYRELFPQAADRGAEESLREVMRSGQPWKVHDFETEIAGRPGTTWWEGECLPLANEQGERDSVLALTLEITERKRAEEDRRRALSELQATYDQSPVRMLQLDTDLRYVRINERLAAMNGIPAAEHIGRTLREVVPDLEPKIEADFRRIIATGEPVLNLELTGETAADPGGQHTWLESWFPLKDAQGAVVGVNVVAQDITESKRMEAGMREADRRKDEFLAMLAHELRNPLAPLRNAAQVMKLIGSPDANQRWAREVIERQIQHLTRLVDDLLDASRISSGKIVLHREPLEVRAVVERAVEGGRPFIEARAQHLSVVLPDEPLHVEGDSTRLVQVVANLLNNAAKYTHEGGHIRLDVAREGDEAVIRVRDNGIGISTDFLPRVFDSFAQADVSLDRAQGGLGLGLTLVRTLVELHGGKVEARSEGPGRGSEFSVRLSAQMSPPAASDAAPTGASKPLARRKSRVLVVEDNPDSAETMALLLELGGHEVHLAHDGEAAIEAALAFVPRVVLCDIGLPGMSGYEVAQRLRGLPQFEQTWLIALTGYGRDEDRQRARQAGFDYHLTKPVEPEALEAMLDSLRPEGRGA